jgi:hypothetical protein
MPLRDKNIEWLEKRVYIPWNAFTGIIQIISATAFTLRSLQSATSTGAAVAAALVGKLAVAATGDGASTLMGMPYDVDRRKQIRFRVFYTQTAVTGTVTWQVLYDQYIATQAGTAGASVIAVPATALDTVIPAAAGTVVANDLRVTDVGIINASTVLDTADGLILAVTTTDALPVAGLGLLGLEMRYSPRMTGGPERNIRAARRLDVTKPMGTVLATTQEGM